ncbi:hypothetical protein MRX96_058871 [Rhipicephalus microplus]
MATKKEACGATEATENADTTPHASRHYAMPLYGRLKLFQGDGSAWPVYEEQGPSLTLLGGNSIQALGVRLPEYQEAVRAVEDIPSLLTKFKALFQPRVGTFTSTACGVASAPAIFQREIDSLFRGMRHVAVYLDDILATGRKEEDYLQNLHSILARLQHAGLKLKLEKCIFFAPSIEYLGHVISLAGLAPTSRKVEAVLKAPKPQNKKELQSYLGLINFYRTFLPNLSSHLQPLHLKLRHGQQWAWRKEQDLGLPAQQGAYHQGSSAEQQYSQLDKKGLTLMFGVERFQQYLWGWRFEAVTDHKPLLGLLVPDKAVPVQASPRVVRWALKLAAYSYRLVYRPAKDLAPADAKPTAPARVSQATSRYPVLSKVVKTASRGEELAERTYSHKSAELSLQQGCLLWGSRVVIRQSLRCRVPAVAASGPSRRGEDQDGGPVPHLVDWPGPGHRSHGAELPGLPGEPASLTPCGDHPPGRSRRSRGPVFTWISGGPFKGHYFLVMADAFSKVAAASGSQQEGEPSAVTNASSAPGADATRITATPPASPETPARLADSATVMQAASDAATHATPVLRRSARHRRPPERYSPG